MLADLGLRRLQGPAIQGREQMAQLWRAGGTALAIAGGCLEFSCSVTGAILQYLGGLVARDGLATERGADLNVLEGADRLAAQGISTVKLGSRSGWSRKGLGVVFALSL